jgi:ParB-like chromosome segregation protein Spo0J
MKATAIKIAEIYIPAALRQPIDPKKLEEIAVSIADIGQQTPILVRPDKER